MGRWLTYLEMSPTAKELLPLTESAMDFFRVEKDLALIVPRAEWNECFYSLKNGFVAPNCPAQFIYFAKTCYDMYHICNLIAPMLPSEVHNKVTRNGYFGAGYTALDAICNFVTPDFQPVTEERYLVRCGDWYEAYIPATNMVAALPASIAQNFTNETLCQVELTPGIGLTLKGRPLAAFGDGAGRSDSFYDLRRTV